jgi:hypothetical protein
MSLQRTTPLNILRTSEVAARHSGFSIAAYSLNDTATAVSLRIKELEFTPGVELFVHKPVEALRQNIPVLSQGVRFMSDSYCKKGSDET